MSGMMTSNYLSSDDIPMIWTVTNLPHPNGVQGLTLIAHLGTHLVVINSPNSDMSIPWKFLYIMLLGWGLNISFKKNLKFQTSCYHFNHKLRPHWWQHKHPIPALSSMPSNLVTVVHYSQGHNCPQLKQLGEWIWYVPLKFQALVCPREK